MEHLLLMASQTGRTHGDLTETVRRMVALYDEVTGRGHSMRYLGPEMDSAATAPLKAIIDAVEKQRSVSVFRVAVGEKSCEYFLGWPKDAIQSYNEFVAINNTPVSREIAMRLGIANLIVSTLSEGGLFVRNGRKLLVSSAVRGDLISDQVSGSYDVKYIPQPYESSDNRSNPQSGSAGKTHIDLDCAVVRGKSGRTLLLVSSQYYRSYTAIVHTLEEWLPAITFVVPEDEVERRVINLVLLPPHDVIIPNGCPATESVLKDHLGGGHLIHVRIDKDFNYNGGFGGLGCMSTVIDRMHCTNLHLNTEH